MRDDSPQPSPIGSIEGGYSFHFKSTTKPVARAGRRQQFPMQHSHVSLVFCRLSQQVTKACAPHEGMCLPANSKRWWTQLAADVRGCAVPQGHSAPPCCSLTSRARPAQPACECSQWELGLLIPTKPLKASENVPIPHREQTKTSSDFHEKPKTLPNGLPCQENRWGAGRRPRPSPVLAERGLGWKPPDPS